MKYFNFFSLTLFCIFLFSACKTDSPVPAKGLEPEASISTSNVPEISEPPKEQPKKQAEAKVIETDSEYQRSVSALAAKTIAFDTFQKDKTEILTIIADLDKSIKNQDYNLWRSYLTPSSISYWSNKLNLQIIATKLPKKNIQMRTLGDYFAHVFIPSRADRQVNEIRYISPTAVKAVEVEGSKDIIYYEFEKIENRWRLKLPVL